MADETTTPKCPNCSEEVKPGKLICRNCGFDIQTGESYNMRIRKAKGAKDRRPPTTGRLGWILLIAFAFVILAGFMYQRRIVEVISEDESRFRNYVERLENVDTLLSRGETEEARDIAQRLLSELENTREGYEGDRAGQSLIDNFIAKTEHAIEQTRENR